MAVITPLSGKLALWKIGSTVYQFTSWTLPFKLDYGEVMHFDGQTDTPGNYWPTVFANWARVQEGSVDGFVNAAANIIPVSWTASVYIGVTGTLACLWSATNGFTFPGLITGNNMGADAAATDPGKQGLAFVPTGPPTRVFS
jgi:hypothetical protein